MVFKHAISWFEIPTVDLDRATAFYELIFDIKLFAMDTPNLQMRLFPIEDKMNIGGSLVYHTDFYKPSASLGPLIYLNANPDLQILLSRVEKGGGKILVNKTQISPEYGYMGIMIDSEGNRIGLHSIG